MEESIRVIYIPMGNYIVSDTITLRPDSVLIALHPDKTQFDLLDRTPGFQGPGTPRPLQRPKAFNIVTGLGLFTNGINSHSHQGRWMSGEDSLMDDVPFLGGHGTDGLNGTGLNPYNNTHTADPDSHRRWDAQYPSLWVLLVAASSRTSGPLTHSLKPASMYPIRQCPAASSNCRASITFAQKSS